MGTKSKLQCEAHYYSFYYKSSLDKSPDTNDFIIKRELNSKQSNGNINNNNIPFNINYTERTVIEDLKKTNEKKEREKIEDISKTQGKIPELNANKDNKNNRSRSLAKNRNKKDQTTITSASEILGFWPKREEFDIEFLNDAELEIAELEFLDDDTENDRNLKLNVLKIYNAQLEEREKRKKYFFCFLLSFFIICFNFSNYFFLTQIEIVNLNTLINSISIIFLFINLVKSTSIPAILY